MSTQHLLVELFVEELPPKALKQIGQAFAAGIATGLEKRQLVEGSKANRFQVFASPRRLAVRVEDVRSQAPDRVEKQKLMPSSVGLDAQGQATPALIKKMTALGASETDVPHLIRESDGKTETLFYESLITGLTLQTGLQDSIKEALAKLPIPKVMTYQLADGWETVHFVRPAHGLVALHGADIVPLSLLGLTSGRETQGHRFEARVSSIHIRDAASYEAQLGEEGAVIASFEKRRALIVAQLKAAAQQIGDNVKPIEDDALLDEVTALVERPNVLIGQFEASYLAVPQECLILTMKANQKYFPLLDHEGKLTNQFLLVSNISPADASAVIEGNERVVRPRLADAQFFFEQDKKKTLASRVPMLAQVVYHNKLGNQLERTERVRRIARWLAENLNADVDLADRAALLAKTDLLTDMVGEFPELQGIMGGYYARHDGEHPVVAQTIAEQYTIRRDHAANPIHQGDHPLITDCYLLADRTETLIGIWGIGLKPTGEKDPFALRRHALSVIKSFEMVGATRQTGKSTLPFTLSALLTFVASTFSDATLATTVVDEVEHFIYERYRNQLTQQFDAAIVESVLSLKPALNDVLARINAVQVFSQLAEADSLAAANKRIGNILKKADVAEPVNLVIHTGLLVESVEQALHSAMTLLQPQTEQCLQQQDYTTYLKLLAGLKQNVDTFFRDVMVMDEDLKIRANRIALLSQLHGLMNRVADLSKLAQ